jgi:hypothetical protein
VHLLDCPRWTAKGGSRAATDAGVTTEKWSGTWWVQQADAWNPSARSACSKTLMRRIQGAGDTGSSWKLGAPANARPASSARSRERFFDLRKPTNNSRLVAGLRHGWASDGSRLRIQPVDATH